MSALDGITLLCEGVDQGPDVRLLESARRALRHVLPLAELVTVRPAGGLEELNDRVRAGKHHTSGEKVFGIRDRDFLTAKLLAEFRDRATQHPPLGPWPLSRHTVESYLLDPAYVATVTGIAAEVVAQALDDLATARLWHDAGRATLRRAAFEVKRQEWPDSPKAWDEAGVLAELPGILAKWQADSASLPVMKDSAGTCHEFVADFQKETLWTRVDGKHLLGPLSTRLRSQDLKHDLLAYAETHAPPPGHRG